MWSRTTRYLLLFALVAPLLATSNVEARYSREKRSMTSMVTNIVEGTLVELESLPIVGSLITAIFNLIITLISNNKIVGRSLESALPCTISLEEGIVCEGMSVEHALGKIIIDEVNEIPSSFLSSRLKWIVDLLIALIVDPTLAVTSPTSN